MILRQTYTRSWNAIANFRKNRFYPIHYYNFWTDQLAKDIWFSKFIEHHGLLKHNQCRINFYSVLGSIQNLTSLRDGVNIFFSGENLHTERFINYRKLCTDKAFDLYVDFDTSLGEKSIRFPLWILYLFQPDCSDEDIKKRVEELRYPFIDNRKDFCSLVASHDWNGIRGEIIDSLSGIDVISSGGTFRNNTNILKTVYANHKREFIRQYKFNICPENSNAPGYVTEKIFHALEAGCVPIYWGSGNNPEPGILNDKVILFWDKESDNKDVIEKIKQLHHDPDYYKSFISQPRLLIDADDIIINMFNTLKDQLIKLITNRNL